MFFLSLFFAFFAWGTIVPMDNNNNNQQQHINNNNSYQQEYICIYCKKSPKQQSAEFAIEGWCADCLEFNVKNNKIQSKSNLLVKALEVLNKKIDLVTNTQNDKFMSQTLNDHLTQFKKMATLLIDISNTYELDNYHNFIKFSHQPYIIFEALDYVFDSALNIRFCSSEGKENFIYDIRPEKKNSFLMKSYSFLMLASNYNQSFYHLRMIKSFMEKLDEDKQKELLTYKPKPISCWDNPKTLLEAHHNLFHEFSTKKENLTIWAPLCIVL